MIDVAGFSQPGQFSVFSVDGEAPVEGLVEVGEGERDFSSIKLAAQM
jgi:hypothetical protein